MEDQPIEVSFIFPDGSFHFVGRFDSIELAEKFVALEQTRSYWKQDTQIIYSPVHPDNGKGM